MHPARKSASGTKSESEEKSKKTAFGSNVAKATKRKIGFSKTLLVKKVFEGSWLCGAFPSSKGTESICSCFGGPGGRTQVPKIEINVPKLSNEKLTKPNFRLKQTIDLLLLTVPLQASNFLIEAAY